LSGENPQFNETFEFEISFPELTMIRFVVLDDDSLDYDFIGQFTLPFDCVQPGQRKAERTWPSVKSSYLGYRHVHLYTIGGDLIANAYLFVHIVINSKSMAGVCSLSRTFSFLSYLLFLFSDKKPRRSLSRYRRSLARRKLRIATFRPVNHKQIDDLFKVAEKRSLTYGDGMFVHL
jgi:hypothetical protein